MEFLKELLQLNEEVKDFPKQMELKDIVENYPNTYKKIFKEFWATNRLVYKGQPLFDKVYESIIRECEKKMKARKFDVEANVAGENFYLDAPLDDSQECYLGYDAKKDILYSGYDVWLDVDAGFTDYIQKHKMDESDEDSIWEEVKEKNTTGILFEMKSSDGKTFKAESIIISGEDVPKEGIFYKAIYGSSKFKSLKLIDLRLD